MKSNPPTYNEHPDEDFLPYLENRLDPQKRADVEKHLAECSECTKDMKSLSSMIDLLRSNKQAFCPEPWQIYEHIISGEDPNSMVAKHINICDPCRSEFSEMRASFQEKIPSHLLKQVTGRHRKATPERDLEPTITIFDRISNFFRLPSIAIGTAIAVLLVVVFMLPQDESGQLGIGFSSVNWEGMMRPKTIQEKAAFIVIFPKSDEKLSQKNVDSIYQALAPDMDMNERFHFVTPAAVSAAIKSKDVNIGNTRQLLTDLDKKLNVAYAAIISIDGKDESYSYKVELYNTQTGNRVKEIARSNMSSGALAAEIKASVRGIILSSKE